MIEYISLLICLPIVFGFHFTTVQHPDWLAYKQEHGKKYETLAEEHARFEIFMETKRKVKQHNQEYHQGKHTWWMKIDPFSDWTKEEMAGLMGYRPPTLEQEAEARQNEVPVNDFLAAPATLDWRTKGAVTPVQNQGSCGSCWTFGAAAALEGRLAIKTGKLTKLSEQNLLDCTNLFEGCGGGWPQHCFIYVKWNGGIDTEASYPYSGKKGWCHYKKAGKGGYDSGYKTSRHGDENALLQAVKEGPVTVCVNANSFGSYGGGIHHCPSSTGLNHAVTLVGYGSDYWLIKNSWGTGWGENGYIRIARNSGNTCGVASDVSWPKV